MKTVSRAISWLLAVVLIIGLSAIPASVGAAQASGVVNIETKSVMYNEVFTVDVSFADEVSIISLGLENLTYDSQYLELISIDWINEDAPIKYWDAEKGKGAMAFASNTDFSGSFLRLTFKAKRVYENVNTLVDLDAFAKVEVNDVDEDVALQVKAGVIKVVSPDKLIGDVNGDLELNADDAIYLLYHTLYGQDLYPVDKSCDYNEDDVVTDDDAVYLLKHTLFPYDYPLPEVVFGDEDMNGDVSKKDEGFDEWKPIW